MKPECVNLKRFTGSKYYAPGILSFLFLCPVIVTEVKAAKADTLFVSDDIVKMELRADFKAIQKERTEEATYHEGELSYRSHGGEHIKLPVKVMVRGHFRRDPVHCDFPPLFLDFKKSEVKKTIFENQKRIKLVTHCQDEEDLIEEYTVYKMYNQVTDSSMKVRMVRMLYFDTSTDSILFTNYSFFIEDKNKVAERNNAVVTEKFYTPFGLEKDNFMKLAFFEFMIGNKDWFITSRKNIDIMQPVDSTRLPFAVPYDFDFCGMIDASYTKPEGVPVEALSVRRVYKGFCYTDAEFEKAFNFYRRLRPVFESIIKKQKLISSYTRRKDIKYIGYFYKVIEDKDLIKKEFLDKCETKKLYNIAE